MNVRLDTGVLSASMTVPSHATNAHRKDNAHKVSKDLFCRSEQRTDYINIETGGAENRLLQ